MVRRRLLERRTTYVRRDVADAAGYDGYLAGAPGTPLAAIANQFGARQYAKVATHRRSQHGLHG